MKWTIIAIIALILLMFGVSLFCVFGLYKDTLFIRFDRTRVCHSFMYIISHLDSFSKDSEEAKK